MRSGILERLSLFDMRGYVIVSAIVLCFLVSLVTTLGVRARYARIAGDLNEKAGVVPFESTLLLHLYPHSIITLNRHILSQDGSLLAACLNAATLALVDAGIPMTDYIASTTVATTGSMRTTANTRGTITTMIGVAMIAVTISTIATMKGITTATPRR